MKFKSLLTVAAASLLLSTAAIPVTHAADEPEYLLRFGHTQTEQDLLHVYTQKWADAVYEKSGGRLKIEVYPSSLLGTEEDVIEQIRQGVPMGWQTDFGRLGQYVKELSAINAPYFFDTVEEAKKLESSQTYQGLNKQLASQYNIANISANWIQGPRHVLAVKAAKNPEEMSSLLIRTPPAPIWVESVNAIGAKAVALPLGEVYTGIQTKVVDGCELPYISLVPWKLYEVAKYVMETGHILGRNTMIVSQSWLDSLPDDLRQILVDECRNAGDALTQALIEETAKHRQVMLDHGVTILTPAELDMQAFKQAGNAAYEKLGLTDVRAKIYQDIGKSI